MSKEQDWPAISEFHARVSKELAENVFYAYEDEIRSRFEKKRTTSSNNSESDYLNDVWVIPCNPNDYDVVGAFEELQTL